MLLQGRHFRNISIIAWLAVVCVGMWVLIDYAEQPGKSGIAPMTWPTTSKIIRSPEQATLVLLIHPKCPCSRATLEELSKIMTRTHTRLKAHVLFFKPKDSTDDWEKTDLWASASIIPEVESSVDMDGEEARLFGAQTSGQALLFNPAGKLVFSGGITGSRGHVGDNIGQEAVVAWVNNARSEISSSSVFGCHLFNSTKDQIIQDSPAEVNHDQAH